MMSRQVTATPVRRVEAGMRVYAIGDIHGCRTHLDALLDLVARDLKCYAGKSALIFLGDYVDRGPDSAGVIARLVEGTLPGHEHHFLLGNHEKVLLDVLRGETAAARGWLTYGGFETLASYGLDRGTVFATGSDLYKAMREAIPIAHRDFLSRLERQVRFGDYLFVHAGIRPGVALDEQSEDDLLWIRSPFLDHDQPHDAMIVHGHTIRGEPEETAARIGIDTGCYQTGRLTALVLEGETRRFLST